MARSRRKDGAVEIDVVEAVMLEAQQVETLISMVCSMDRAAIKRQFLNFRGDFPIDFTPEFLDTLPVDRLRHILVALCLQTQQVPSWEPFSDAA